MAIVQLTKGLTQRPPEGEEAVEIFIAKELLPLLRQALNLLSDIADFFTGENITIAFDTNAGLRASTLLAKAAIVSGAAAAGDGLGGTWVYVATDTVSADDNSTIIVRTADLRRYYLL